MLDLGLSGQHKCSSFAVLVLVVIPLHCTVVKTTIAIRVWCAQFYVNTYNT
jgi:hypothetical protein